MKILFLSDNFPPEVNAPASRTYEHCREWVKAGHQVTVITCAPNFPKGKVFEGYRNRRSEEFVDGIRVIRVRTYISKNEGIFRRILDYWSYGLAAFWEGIWIPADLIVGTSPQFFTAVGARKLAFWRRIPWVLEIRDLWPESIKTVGAIKQSFLIKYLEWEEMRNYKQATKIVTVTNSFRDFIMNRGIEGEKIHIVKNGANFERFVPQEKDNTLLQKIGLNGEFLMGYIGTHGLAHKLDFLLDCAKKLSGKPVHFLFVGDGAEKDALMQQYKQMNLSNVTFFDSVPKEEIPGILSVLDASVINLKRTPLFKTVIPSKIFEASAMQVPILLGVEGEAKELVEEYQAGLCYLPEDINDFIQKVEMLTSDPDLILSIKEGQKMLAKDHDRSSLASDMLKVFEDAIV